MKVYNDFSGMVDAQGEAVRDFSEHPLVASEDKAKMNAEMQILRRRQGAFNSLGMPNLKVFTAGGSVAGWYAPGSGEMGISEAMLDGPRSELTHVITHEIDHGIIGVSGVDFASEISEDQRQALGVVFYDPASNMEGFHEARTISKTGLENFSGYGKQVEMARRIDSLSKNHRGISIQALYSTSDPAAMVRGTRETAEIIMFHKAAKMEGFVGHFPKLSQAPNTVIGMREFVRDLKLKNEESEEGPQGFSSEVNVIDFRNFPQNPETIMKRVA